VDLVNSINMERQEIERILSRDKEVEIHFKNETIKGMFYTREQLDVFREMNKFIIKKGNELIYLKGDDIISIKEVKNGDGKENG
jgi:hypothetical protein